MTVGRQTVDVVGIPKNDHYFGPCYNLCVHLRSTQHLRMQNSGNIEALSDCLYSDSPESNGRDVENRKRALQFLRHSRQS